jgi:hypothetical protein
MAATAYAYGYHPYDDAEWAWKFRTFLHGQAWTHAEGPVANIYDQISRKDSCSCQPR